MKFDQATICVASLLVCTVLGGERQVHVNDTALVYATNLIARGAFNPDKKNVWGEHQPSAEEENGFIREHGFAEYAKWHLAVDESHPADTKARYKFPYGDFETVHRCPLLAAKNRARQYGYVDVEQAAGRLIDLLAARTNSTQPTR